MEQNSGSIATLDSKFTGLFEVVNALPNINDAQLGKIYCVKDTSSTETENKYIEWIKLKNTDDTYKFEKVGEFNAAPDLSGYAKLSGAVFTGRVILMRENHKIFGNSYIEYPTVRSTIACENSPNNHTAFGTAKNFLDVGTPEDFIFTLEDGSIVTKSIRVISTTSQTGA